MFCPRSAGQLAQTTFCTHPPRHPLCLTRQPWDRALSVCILPAGPGPQRDTGLPLACGRAERGQCTADGTRGTFQGLCGRISGVALFMTFIVTDETSCRPSAALTQAEISPGEGRCKQLPEGPPGAGPVCTCQRSGSLSENRHRPLWGHGASGAAVPGPGPAVPEERVGGGWCWALPLLTCPFSFCACCSGCQCLHSELPHVHPVGTAVCLFGRLPGARVCAICLWLRYTRGEWWPSFFRAGNKKSKCLGAQHGPEHLLCVKSSSPYNEPVRWVLLFFT